MIIYDNRFDSNEWFVIIGFCIGYLLLFLLPKRFPLKVSFVFVMCGVYSGFVYDHSLSVEPVSFYDVNDRSGYEVMDFISYWVYGVLSYLFFYIWDWWQFKFRIFPFYVLGWGLFAVGLEYVADRLNVYHYQHGYKLAYSFPIYLFTFSLWGLLYRYYRQQMQKQKGRLSQK